MITQDCCSFNWFLSEEGVKYYPCFPHNTVTVSEVRHPNSPPYSGLNFANRREINPQNGILVTHSIIEVANLNRFKGGLQRQLFFDEFKTDIIMAYKLDTEDLKILDTEAKSLFYNLGTILFPFIARKELIETRTCANFQYPSSKVTVLKQPRLNFLCEPEVLTNIDITNKEAESKDHWLWSKLLLASLVEADAQNPQNIKIVTPDEIVEQALIIPIREKEEKEEEGAGIAIEEDTIREI